MKTYRHPNIKVDKDKLYKEGLNAMSEEINKIEVPFKWDELIIESGFMDDDIVENKVSVILIFNQSNEVLF